MAVAMSEAAVAARTSADSLDDAIEKRAWLKTLNVPVWGKAAVMLSEAASQAAGMAWMNAAGVTHPDDVCVAPSAFVRSN